MDEAELRKLAVYWTVSLWQVGDKRGRTSLSHQALEKFKLGQKYSAELQNYAKNIMDCGELTSFSLLMAFLEEVKATPDRTTRLTNLLGAAMILTTILKLEGERK